MWRSRLSLGRFVLVAALMFLSLCSMSAHTSWLGYDSYEDCMLGKMKGQDRSMYGAADKECKRLLRVEFEIPESSIKWHFSKEDGPETKITIEDSKNYEITSGVFRFSRKPCSETRGEDFDPPASIKFSQGVGLYTSSIWDQHCAIIETLRGRYK